ncbi:MAG: hypothetical protein WD021_07835 [Rhodothermales bacterium]
MTGDVMMYEVPSKHGSLDLGRLEFTRSSQVTGIPGMPEEPSTPGHPEEPETPGHPQEPDTPGHPSEPDTPGHPSEPETPGRPTEPETPHPDAPNEPDRDVRGNHSE